MMIHQNSNKPRESPEASHPPRVVFVVPKYPPPVLGGLERQAHELARELVRQGVRLLVLSGAWEADQELDAVVEGVRVRRVPYRRGPVGRLIGLLRICSMLISFRKQYDVIHLHNVSWFGAVVVACSRLLRKPILSKLPSSGSGGLGAKQSSFPGRCWLRLFTRSEAVVALSHESVEELVSVKYPYEQILRVPNGIDTNRFLHDRYRREDRERKVNVIFMGRLIHDKGVRDLIMAWAKVREALGKVAKLTICGSGPEEKASTNLVEKLGLRSEVVFMGHVKDIWPHLTNADIFVLPSYREGSSNAILEAMAIGLPIVSTCVGGTPMLVGEEGSHFLVAPGDVKGLAEKLGTLIMDRDLRRSIGSSMRMRVNEFFSIDVIAGTYVETYSRLAVGEERNVEALASPVFRVPPRRNK